MDGHSFEADGPPGPPGRQRPGGAVVAVAVAAVAVIAAGGLALATLSSAPGRQRPRPPAALAGTPQHAGTPPARGRAPAPPSSPASGGGQCRPQGQGHATSVPLCALPPGTIQAGGAPAATLVIVSGAPSIAVRVAGRGDPGMRGILLRAATAGGYGARPELGVVGPGGKDRSGNGGDGGTVVGLSLPPAGAAAGSPGGGAALSVTLSADVTWQLDFGGGTSTTSVDMRGGRVAGLDFGQGSSQVSVRLPRPRGTTALKLDGGASQLTVSVPAGVPARVAAGAGAGEVTLAGARHAGVGGGTVFTQPGYGSAAGRLNVDATSGVAQLTVTEG